MATVTLRKTRETRVRGGHPWIYASEIERVDGEFTDGDIVNVADFRGKFIGRGFYNPQSQISLRVQMLVEDGLMAVLERHTDGKVFAECCVRLEPGGVNLSIWDSGGAFDMGEDDVPITSFRTFVVNSLMENIGAKKNMFVFGFNRSSFYFPLIQ